MTLRRLFVLVRALPYESEFKTALRTAYERSLKPTPDRIRDRQAYWDAKKAERGGA